MRHMGAMQAQELGVARWSVAQRATGVDIARVDDALARGTIVRTHTLRPTWHFVAAEDLSWIMEVTGPRVNQLSAFYQRQQGLDDAVFGHANDVLTSALEGGRHLTRVELGAALERAGIAATGMRLGFIMGRAELDLVVCSGAVRGKQQTYALVAERVGRVNELHGDEALAELTRRYFTSHGPATVKDFTTWASLTVALVRRGLDVVGAGLESATWDGRTYLFAPGTLDGSAGRRPVIDLVQVYDELVMGYLESRDVMQTPRYSSPLSRERRLLHPVLLDGRMAGQWRRVPRASDEELELFFPALLTGGAAEALEAALARYRDAAAGEVRVRLVPA